MTHPDDAAYDYLRKHGPVGPYVALPPWLVRLERDGLAGQHSVPRNGPIPLSMGLCYAARHDPRRTAWHVTLHVNLDHGRCPASQSFAWTAKASGQRALAFAIIREAVHHYGPEKVFGPSGAEWDGGSWVERVRSMVGARQQTLARNGMITEVSFDLTDDYGTPIGYVTLVPLGVSNGKGFPSPESVPPVSESSLAIMDYLRSAGTGPRTWDEIRTLGVVLDQHEAALAALEEAGIVESIVCPDDVLRYWTHA